MEARMANQSKWRPFVQISFCPHRSTGFRASFHHSSPKSHPTCLRLCLSLITGRNCTWQKAPTKNKQIHSQETSLQHSGCLFSGHVEEGMAPTRKCLNKKKCKNIKAYQSIKMCGSTCTIWPFGHLHTKSVPTRTNMKFLSYFRSKKSIQRKPKSLNPTNMTITPNTIHLARRFAKMTFNLGKGCGLYCYETVRG